MIDDIDRATAHKLSREGREICSKSSSPFFQTPEGFPLNFEPHFLYCLLIASHTNKLRVYWGSSGRLFQRLFEHENGLVKSTYQEVCRSPEPSKRMFVLYVEHFETRLEVKNAERTAWAASRSTQWFIDPQTGEPESCGTVSFEQADPHLRSLGWTEKGKLFPIDLFLDVFSQSTYPNWGEGDPYYSSRRDG